MGRDRRDDLEIRVEILNAAKDRISKADIVKRTKLRYPKFFKHANYLITIEALEETDGFYKIRDKGKEILKRYEKLMEILPYKEINL